MSSSCKYPPTNCKPTGTGSGHPLRKWLATNSRVQDEAPKGESGLEATVHEPATKLDKDNDVDVNALPPASTGKYPVFLPWKKSPATESEGTEPGATLPATSGGGKCPKKWLMTKSRAWSNSSNGKPDLEGYAGQLAIGAGEHPNISANHPYASTYNVRPLPPVVSWYRTQDWNAETEDE
ncbi:hypothetical protein FRC11_014367 [Ceratobasidium sp. 423]|nr:hypothetical protein FRC11_014367 [Ceratobasidium sp. 423]